MRLSSGHSRVLAVILLLAAAGLVYAFVMMPIWQSHQETRNAVASHEEQIARLLGVAANTRALSEQRNALQSRGELGRYLLAGSSTTLAAAGLQERIKSIVEGTGGRLTSTRVLNPESEHGFTRVAIGVRLALDTVALQEVLYQLEGQRPLLVIDELMVIARRARSTRRTRDKADNLDVRFQISGFMSSAGEDV